MFILCSIYSSAIPEEIKKIFAFVCRNAGKKIELGMKNVIAGRTVDVIKSRQSARCANTWLTVITFATGTIKPNTANLHDDRWEALSVE